MQMTTPLPEIRPFYGQPYVSPKFFDPTAVGAKRLVQAPATLFLDIDGVLNVCGPHYLEGVHAMPGFPRTFLNQVPLDNLCAYLAKFSRVEVVISSTWRITWSLEQILAFGEVVPAFGEILSYVPLLRWRTPHLGKKRGDDVAQYCEKHNVKRFACIDDDSDFFPNQRLFKIDATVGFVETPEMRAFIA